MDHHTDIVRRRRWVVLAVICLSVYVINLDITIVNAALPTLVSQLHASNRDLQWVVDAYNLTFATFVLPAGALSDRFGRRGGLMLGLGVFAAATAVGSAAHDVGGLIGARAVMGLGAAVIFPATLSIIAQVFPDRRERALAIAVWGATTGIGVATGPLAGGALLEHFWWGSVFLYMAPVAVLAMALTWWLVPTSRDPATPRLDPVGLLLSAVAFGTLVWTVIEAPGWGWSSVATVSGLAVAGAAMVGFVVWELRRTEPMVDVRLFRHLRFVAACTSVTVAWFCLFGFILLITQYFQYFKGFGPLTFGLALAPVAVSIAAGSVLGMVGVYRIGVRSVVTTGLILMGLFFLWVAATVESSTGYWPEIVGQMVTLGLGLGLTTAPATETIMDVVPRDKAAVGSALNDATRELGGTLGVAVIGSVFSTAYIESLDATGALHGLPQPVAAVARASVGRALQADPGAPQLRAAVDHAFHHALHLGCLVAGAVALAGGLLAALTLPTGRLVGRLEPPAHQRQPQAEPVPAAGCAS